MNTTYNNLYLWGEQDRDKASFQIEESDLVQLITEGRIRHANGPAHYAHSESVTWHTGETGNINKLYFLRGPQVEECPLLCKGSLILLVEDLAT